MEEYKSIYPAFEKNNIAVYLASSDYYAPYAGVFIESLVENASPSNCYDILILMTDISDQNKELLLMIVENYQHISLRFVDISSIMERFTFQVSMHHSKYNFYRLTGPEVLQNYDKIIYVDCDLVVNCDIAELFNIDLKDNYVAATRCIGMAASYARTPERKDYVDNVLKLKKQTWYFNSGVMLLNLSLIRRQYTTEYFLNMASSDYWMFCDQCVLNVLFEGQIIYLPLEWNVLSHSTHFHHEKYLTDDLFEEYLEARRAPKISHFAGNNIPVIKPTIDMYPYYWKYARNTPFYELLISRMIEETMKKEQRIPKKMIGATQASSKSNEVKKPQQRTQKEKNMKSNIANSLFPKGTKRREIIKKLFR